MTLKYGLIGCGMMGCEHIRNINLLEGAEVYVVYDPVEELAKEASFLAGGARVAESLDALIRAPAIDAIVIASPNFLHMEQLEQIASARQIPILCEKPLFTKFEDSLRINYLVKEYAAPIWVAMEYRYMPAITDLLERSNAVTGGIKMLTLREHRLPFLEKVGDWNRLNRNTGGTLVEKCCHFFDLMRLVLKSEPVRVSASAGQMVNHLDEAYGGEDSDIWDGGYVIYDFENGARAMLELCMFADGSRWNEEIMAVGHLGKIECRLPGPQRFWPAHLGASPLPEITEYPRSPKNPVTRQIAVDPVLIEAGDHHGSTFFQHQKFLQMITSRGVPDVSLEDGRRAVMMGLAAQRAAIEGRVISLDFDG